MNPLQLSHSIESSVNLLGFSRENKVQFLISGSIGQVSCGCFLFKNTTGLSGSVAQTWIPASLERFRWTSEKTLALRRASAISGDGDTLW